MAEFETTNSPNDYLLLAINETPTLDEMILASGMNSEPFIPTMPKRLDHATHRYIPKPKVTERPFERIEPSPLTDISEGGLALLSLMHAKQRGLKNVPPLNG